jgi:hypothetical protein
VKGAGDAVENGEGLKVGFVSSKCLIEKRELDNRYFLFPPFEKFPID